MELIEIIISSIKIFSIVATVVILASYIIFKIKSKNRKKVRAELMTVQHEELLDEQQIEIPEEFESEELPQYEEQPEVMIPYRNINQRFQVINEDNRMSMEDYPEVNPYYRPNIPAFSDVNNAVMQSSHINYKPVRYSQNAYRAADYKHTSNDAKGIYSLYSLAVSEPMHKMKV